MSVITLILLLVTGILAVTAVENCTRKDTVTNCCELIPLNQFTFSRSIQNTSGIYWLNKFCGDDCMQAEAYCDTSNGGGGWLVVHRGQNGLVNFNRGWGEYEDGFGSLTGEVWCRLRVLHYLTGQGVGK